MTVKILHFADAHIDMIPGGKRDPETGLSIRVMDFLRSLDEIVDEAIQEKVDLVLFPGDAYRNSTPVPTYQREWGKRLRRLADAHIPTLLIEGNHDAAPSSNRASAMQELNTFNIPFIHLAKAIHLWTPNELDGVPIQVLTVPWLSKSIIAAKISPDADSDQEMQTPDLLKELENQVLIRIESFLAEADPAIPVVFMAHYPVSGAVYSNQNPALLGSEVTLTKGLVCDSRFSYSALGHIHLFQDLNKGAQPPAIYSGSIERVNFGEWKEDKGFVTAEVNLGHTTYTFHKLHTRKMFNREVEIKNRDTIQDEIMSALPDAAQSVGALVRLVVDYPQEWEPGIDERAIRTMMSEALEFHFVRKVIRPGRIRFVGEEGISAYKPTELVRKYFEAASVDEVETAALVKMAEEIITGCNDISLRAIY